jgi:uncharacterized protein with HEPN domain
VQRDPEASLEDILLACEKIADYTGGLTLDAFRKDRKTIDAVVRNLEVIGEAAARIPDETRAHLPEVEWQRMAAMRNILIHAYFTVDEEIVWEVVQTKIPVLSGSVERFLRRT